MMQYLERCEAVNNVGDTQVEELVVFCKLETSTSLVTVSYV